MPKPKLSFWDIKPGLRFISKGNMGRIWTVRYIVGRKVMLACGEKEMTIDYENLKSSVKEVLP
jgi:hypothetical protein